MGAILDSIVKKNFITGTEIVASGDEFITDVAKIGGVEEAFVVSLSYEGPPGGVVNADLYLEISIDGVNFSPILEAQNVTDESGSHIWDIIGTGATFCRVRVANQADPIDLLSIKLSGKRRH